MSPCSKTESQEVGCCNPQRGISHTNLNGGVDGNLELEEEDEDEDVDFNPFLIETPSPEASSSLSSENEGLGNNAKKISGTCSNYKDKLTTTKPVHKLQILRSRDSENEDDEVIMQNEDVEEGNHGKEELSGDSKKEATSINQSDVSFVTGGYCVPIGSNVGTTDDKREEELLGEAMISLPDLAIPKKQTIQTQRGQCDDEVFEDAICRRTRARYSLADLTLDELETFLQESDEEDYLQHVDEEEEYRKFLAAVVGRPDGDDYETQGLPEKEDIEDDDEENDADFEIEIEEALESDLDESTRNKGKKERVKGASHRPETRQKKRQNVSAQNKDRLLGLAQRPLRPLLPWTTNAHTTNSYDLEGQILVPDNAVLHCSSSLPKTDITQGFTVHQIGQLHCLIHEHIQLLIQVFSLCVLEPSKQHIANEVKRMILEMVDKREEVLAWKKVPYPDSCFCPAFVLPSVTQFPQFHLMQETLDPSISSYFSSPSDPQRQFHSSTSTSVGATSYNRSSMGHSDGIFSNNVCGGHLDHVQTAADSRWAPVAPGSCLSVLDVAPLSLVRGFLADVEGAVQEYKQQRVEDASFCTRLEKEPLFPLPTLTFVDDTNLNLLQGAAPMGPNSSRSLSTAPQPRKTMAATLVESAKKRSVALVSKDIVKLVQRFFPLFNAALFPHKPPPAATANRVLFTDAEDELLAMGLMTYNNDWKAIQQRFLPCKSKHQIFVRQKNRSSAKAPENPIKAVRRMKTSPLTAEEKARIEEGIKVLNHDWVSIWKYFVPHRDPSLLPRQWRVALGTQKSYKTDGASKEKRRLYEASRRKKFKASLNSVQNVDNDNGEDDTGDDETEDEDEAYVHEAFLADWRPSTSRLTASEIPASGGSEINLQSTGLLPQEDTRVSRKGATGVDVSRELLLENGPLHQVTASKSSGNLQLVSPFAHSSYTASCTVSSSRLVSDYSNKPARNQLNLRPYRVRKNNTLQLVKLAPDLPPINLPPSVRVIPQSAFQNYQCGSHQEANTLCKSRPTSQLSGPAATDLCTNSKISVCGSGREDMVSRSSPVAKSRTVSFGDVKKDKHVVSSFSNKNERPCFQDPKLSVDQQTSEENSEADLQMHPLLFQVPEEGYPLHQPVNLNTPTAASAFTIFPRNPLHDNLNLFFKTHRAFGSVNGGYPVLKSKESLSSFCTLDFHPLLQRTSNINSDLGSQSLQLSVPADACLTEEARRKDDTLIADPEPISHEKVSGLDLEMHLSSGTSKERSAESRDISQQPIVSMYSNKENFSATSPQNIVRTDLWEEDRVQVTAGCKTVDVVNSDINRSMEGHLDDQALQEIVMEQEELSDSEEEVGERVEFECEEMDDSEVEGSDSEHLVDMQNKEIQSTGFGEEEAIPCEEHDKRRRPRTTVPYNNFFVAKDTMDSHNSRSIARKKNAKRRLMELDPELCGPQTSYAKHKCESTNRDGVGKSSPKGLYSRRGRCRSSRRKPNKEEAKPCLLSKVTATSRKKSRKGICQTNNCSLTVDSSGQTSANLGKVSDNCRMVDNVHMQKPSCSEPSSPSKTNEHAPEAKSFDNGSYSG